MILVVDISAAANVASMQTTSHFFKWEHCAWWSLAFRETLNTHKYTFGGYGKWIYRLWYNYYISLFKWLVEPFKCVIRMASYKVIAMELYFWHQQRHCPWEHGDTPASYLLKSFTRSVLSLCFSYFVAMTQFCSLNSFIMHHSVPALNYFWWGLQEGNTLTRKPSLILQLCTLIHTSINRWCLQLPAPTSSLYPLSFMRTNPRQSVLWIV